MSMPMTESSAGPIPTPSDVLRRLETALDLLRSGRPEAMAMLEVLVTELKAQGQSDRLKPYDHDAGEDPLTEPVTAFEGDGTPGNSTPA